jgi:hypothetical protein
VSDSESEPSGDKFDESEIIKLLPTVKKLKKINKKNFKKKKINKRNIIGLNHNISNSNSHNNNNNTNLNNNIRYFQNNINLSKNNNSPNNIFSLPKLKDNFNKNKLNVINNYNSLDVNIRSKKELSSLEDVTYHLNHNNKIQKDISSKKNVFKINPTSPNTNNNIKQTNLNININISLNTNVETSDKYTQTEEIYFKNNWRHFIGMCKILTPKFDPYPLVCQLKPIKFNFIKNSYSFSNKKDIVLNNSAIPPQQNADLLQNKKSREFKILNMIKSNKFNFENFPINKTNKGNRNCSMLPFGPLHNNLLDKEGNNNNMGNYSNVNRINANNLKNYPVVKSKSIFLKKLNGEKEN